jgi:hypothetical protein
MGAAGRARAVTYFSEDKCADQTATLYRDCLTSH